MVCIIYHIFKACIPTSRSYQNQRVPVGCHHLEQYKLRVNIFVLYCEFCERERHACSLLLYPAGFYCYYIKCRELGVEGGPHALEKKIPMETLTCLSMLMVVTHPGFFGEGSHSY